MFSGDYNIKWYENLKNVDLGVFAIKNLKNWQALVLDCASI